MTKSSDDVIQKVASIASFGARVQFSTNGEEGAIWATREQIAELFHTDPGSIKRHIKNVFKSQELEKESNVRKARLPDSDEPVRQYSLDVVLSVGYRIYPRQATEFRKWATGVLKQFITSDYVLGEKLLTDHGERREDLIKELRELRSDDLSHFKEVMSAVAMTSIDYHTKSPKELGDFFTQLIDAFYHAVSGKTTCQLVLDHAKGDRPQVCVIARNGRHEMCQAVNLGRNYLDKRAERKLALLYEQLIPFAENKMLNGEKMTLDKWAHQLKTLLTINGYEPFACYNCEYFRANAGDKTTRELGRQ